VSSRENPCSHLRPRLEAAGLDAARQSRGTCERRTARGRPRARRGWRSQLSAWGRRYSALATIACPHMTSNINRLTGQSTRAAGGAAWPGVPRTLFGPPQWPRPELLLTQDRTASATRSAGCLL